MQKRATAALAGRRTRAVRRPASAKKRIKNAIALIALGLLSVTAALSVFLLITFVQITRTLPSLADIGNFKPSEGTRIYYADGPLMAVLATENRRPVKLQDVSKHLVDATIATEDSRFYEHGGVDYHGIFRALYRNIVGGDLKREGASTITQQLARNISELGLTRRKLFTRKIAEAVLAMRIEQTFTKDEILELYLNQIYYGAGAYGAEAAARTYFHRSSKHLTLGQAALLAGLPQSPSYYSSPQHRDAALRRRDQVLDRMVETGKITATERDKARAEPLHIFKAEPSSTQVFGAPYVVDYVVSQLVNDQGSQAGYGLDAVYSGWRIYTTIDSRIQHWAEKTLREGVHRYGDYANQGALVCIDPKTGYVRAMVGGLDYKRDQFNVVIQGKRQPGSSFKPILYTAALDTGKCSLDSSFRDDPDFPGERAGNTWRPKNYSGRYSYDSKSVLTAIKFSINTIAVKVAMLTGLHTVIDYAHRMGITTELAPYPPLALGASAVRPLELCSAFSVFANGGRRALPMCISRVLATNGDVIEDRIPQTVETGIKSSTIEAMNTALHEVVQSGTGTLAADVPNAHGKTGTTSDARDAWFSGYTPELTTVIWVAREHRTRKGKLDRKSPYLDMPGATGGHLCAPIWRDFMLKAVPIQQAVNKAAMAPPPPPKPAPSESKPDAQAQAERARSEKRRSRSANEANAAAPDPAADGVPQPSAIGGEIAPPTTSAPPAQGGAAPAAPVPTGGPRISAPATTPVVMRRDPLPAPRPSEPSGRIAAPVAPRRDSSDDMVSVTLCADSMRRATRWCDQTVQRRMRRRDVPGFCRIHRPPPGEPDG